MLCGAVQRTQLGVEQILTLQQQARATHAKEGIVLTRQVQIGHLLVTADVQGADDQPPTGHDLDHLAINLILLLLVGGAVALQEQKFGAHQADAFGAGIQR